MTLATKYVPQTSAAVTCVCVCETVGTHCCWKSEVLRGKQHTIWLL